MELEYDAICFDLFGTLTDDRGKPLDGARAVLESMRGARVAIVTSAPRAFVATLLQEACFGGIVCIVTSDDVARTKPDPECYRLAAQRLNTDPARTLAVEDSLQGIESARGAGMDVVAIRGGSATAPQRNALLTIGHLRELSIRKKTDGRVALALARPRSNESYD